ncbi:MAG: hypothetical protein RR201_00200 [Malacoplasma sp.]
MTDVEKAFVEKLKNVVSLNIELIEALIIISTQRDKGKVFEITNHKWLQN